MNALIGMKVRPEMKKTTHYFTAGNLNSSFVSITGHLPVCCKNNFNARGSAWGGWG